MLLTTREAAVALGVGMARVHQLIKDGRLKAREFGPVYIIDSRDIEAAKKAIRPPGRPRKLASKKKNK